MNCGLRNAIEYIKKLQVCQFEFDDAYKCSCLTHLQGISSQRISHFESTKHLIIAKVNSGQAERQLPYLIYSPPIAFALGADSTLPLICLLIWRESQGDPPAHQTNPASDSRPLTFSTESTLIWHDFCCPDPAGSPRTNPSPNPTFDLLQSKVACIRLEVYK